MQLVGFTKDLNGKYVEFLPDNEQLTSTQQKRAIFFNLLNSYMSEDISFTQKEIAIHATIEEIFKQKIISQIDISCVKTFKPYTGINIKIDISTSLLIYAYFLNKTIPFPLMRKPILLAGKLINLIYQPKGLSLLLDIEDMFLHLVYERIKKVNRYADVLLYDNTIVIQDKRDHVPTAMIIPSYRKIEKDLLHEDKMFEQQMHHVQQTLDTGNSEHIYLVYPKHPNFKKHIEIKLPYIRDEKYKIKVMPYSFSFCTKNI